MKNTQLKMLLSDEVYTQIKHQDIFGRYVTNEHLELFTNRLSEKLNIEIMGSSVLDKPISMIQLGTGKIKILAWSQMHGNESTTTKAVFDLVNAFQKMQDDPILMQILEACTLYIVPILNPDGSEAYTRVNANEVDLNRDMKVLSQPESRLLMNLYERFQPDFCLNLHDQRTIFSTGETNKPATLSFLTPSKDEDRSIDKSRKQSMALIAGMVDDLGKELRGRIGRYDDSFNINCAGDTFQHLSVPTILFEAGHFPGDYQREKTRKYVFQALISCVYQISTGYKAEDYKDYFKIPENKKLFNDVVIKNALVEGERCHIHIQFKEVLNKGKVEFRPEIESISKDVLKFGHREIDAEGQEVRLPENTRLNENVVVNKIIIKSTELEVNYV